MTFISWGETFVLVGASFYFIGRKDLPKASRFLGTQVGRIVGLLQGARVRADRFTAQNEMRQLQNELRSGLRELDTVRAEMAVAVSSQSVGIGRSLGPTVKSANKQKQSLPVQDAIMNSKEQLKLNTSTTNTIPSSMIPTAVSSSSSIENDGSNNTSIEQIRKLAPRSQAVAAVAEEEWSKQGIGFQSYGERGATDHTGSGILSNLYKQSLIHDQHDRAIQEQDAEMNTRLSSKMAKKAEQKQKEE